MTVWFIVLRLFNNIKTASRERMVIEIISWPNLYKRWCWTQGSNPRPPEYQSDGPANWPSRPGVKAFVCLLMCHPKGRLGAVARSEASPLGMQAAPSSIPTSGTFFRGDLVMKTFLRPFSLFRWFKKSSCQLLAKECALSTGKLPRRLAQGQCGWLR